MEERTGFENRREVVTSHGDSVAHNARGKPRSLGVGHSVFMCTFCALLHCWVQRGAVFCVHLVFPTEKKSQVSIIMLSVFPSSSLVLEQIHIFKASVQVQLVVHAAMSAL